MATKNPALLNKETVYSYTAISPDGKSVKGYINGNDISDAKLRIKQSNLTLVKISEGNSFLASLGKQRRRKIDLKTVATFCSQLNAIISSGVNILTGIELLSKQSRDKNMKAVMTIINGEVQKGRTISEAMDSEKTGLPFLLVSMIAVGEVSGGLENILGQMSIFYEKESITRSKVTGAMIYPAILSLVGIAMLVFFLNFVMPEIMSIIVDAGVPLPLITRVVMAAVTYIKAYWWIAGLVILFVGIMVKVIVPKEKIIRLRDIFILKIPLVGTMVQSLITTRFMKTLALMLGSGIPIVNVLETLEKTLDNTLARETIKYSIEGVKKGERLSTTLSQGKFFEPLIFQLIAIGEETGQMEQILNKMGDQSEKETDQYISKVVASIEPVFTIIVGIAIGVLIISMMLPMFGMIGNLKGKS